jgi:hypothetical protein
VTRSIVFTHQGATPRRMMINLSDTHVSIANLVDMENPVQEAEIEIAPYYNQIYRFGEYLVEQVQGKPESWGSPNQNLMTFRVKKAGGSLEEAPVLARFEMGSSTTTAAWCCSGSCRTPATARTAASGIRRPPRRWSSTCGTRRRRAWPARSSCRP